MEQALAEHVARRYIIGTAVKCPLGNQCVTGETFVIIKDSGGGLLGESIT